MGLVINHNMMAMNAARNLSTVYSRLASSTSRLSSGLRIGSAADDAAGLAVRELMRADIAVINQGVRNASDAISMIQTAEGAMGVIDEKLIRMKELAEQAATGTYTDAQRSIMNDEYQAMAAEIDRIANATDFNGIKMLDGTMADLHGGNGIKIHFGTGNSSTEDYYYLSISDMTATTGLDVGTAAGTSTTDVDVWYNEYSFGAASGSAVSDTDGFLFFGYDYDNLRTSGSAVGSQIDNVVGLYEVTSGTTDLNDLVAAINQGTAARVGISIGYSAASALNSALNQSTSISSIAYVVVGDVKVGLYASATGVNYLDADTDVSIRTDSISVDDLASALVNAVNGYTSGNVFGVWNGDGSGTSNIMFFAKTAGEAGNGFAAWENISSDGVAGHVSFAFAGDNVSTTSAGGGITEGSFHGGGESWVTAAAVQDNNGRYHLQITGAEGGDLHDIEFYSPSATGIFGNTGSALAGAGGWAVNLTYFDDMQAGEWVETQDASGSATAVTGAGRNILTQTAAQQALEALDAAISIKDTQRASLGALQNRLENTITNLSIQAENLQAAESRISDVDVAVEMTEFTKNMILAQAATSMLAQANGLAQLALSVLG